MRRSAKAEQTTSSDAGTAGAWQWLLLVMPDAETQPIQFSAGTFSHCTHHLEERVGATIDKDLLVLRQSSQDGLRNVFPSRISRRLQPLCQTALQDASRLRVQAGTDLL